MKYTILGIAPLAALLLASCSMEPTTVTAPENDPQASEVAAAPPVKLPPAMLASKSYRCKDNSTVFVDWFNDNMTANVRTERGGTPTALSAPAAGEPYVGGGYTLTGTADAASATVTKPGGSAQSCTAA
jgi:hypothetical protein